MTQTSSEQNFRNQDSRDDDRSACETVFAYHERTKHHFQRYARSLGFMDWATQPHPFRYYEGSLQTQLDFNRTPHPLTYDQLYEDSPLSPKAVDLAKTTGPVEKPQFRCHLPARIPGVMRSGPDQIGLFQQVRWLNDTALPHTSLSRSRTLAKLTNGIK